MLAERVVGWSLEGTVRELSTGQWVGGVAALAVAGLIVVALLVVAVVQLYRIVKPAILGTSRRATPLVDPVRTSKVRKLVWQTMLAFGLGIILAQLFKNAVMPLLALAVSGELPKVSDTALIIFLLIVIVGLLATIADKLSK